MDAPTRYRTLARPTRHEPDKIKGSRFVADLAPVVDAASAEAFLASVRAEFPDASHHCFAWILDPAGKATRASDDGEPGGSAGLPILRQLEGHALTGLVCVVSRWFGGTKLGVGGLMRAYGGTAGEAIDRAEVVEVRVRRSLTLDFPYEVSGVLEGLLRACEARQLEAAYGSQVRLRLSVPLDRLEEFLEAVGERSAGRARVDLAPLA